MLPLPVHVTGSLLLVDDFLLSLEVEMRKAGSEYTRGKVEREEELVSNRHRQEVLRAELQQLEEREEELVRQNGVEKALQSRADEVREGGRCAPPQNHSSSMSGCEPPLMWSCDPTCVVM